MFVELIINQKIETPTSYSGGQRKTLSTLSTLSVREKQEVQGRSIHDIASGLQVSISNQTRCPVVLEISGYSPSPVCSYLSTWSLVSWAGGIFTVCTCHDISGPFLLGTCPLFQSVGSKLENWLRFRNLAKDCDFLLS